jgi:hypothetical protein
MPLVIRQQRSFTGSDRYAFTVFFNRTIDSLLAPNPEEDLTPLLEESVRLARLKLRSLRR